jgi:hypothetical protein
MKMLDEFLNSFISRLKNSSDLDGVKIIRAYPNKIAPTVISTPIVAIGIDEQEHCPTGVGEEELFTQPQLFCDIFLPWEEEKETARKILTEICKIGLDYSLLSVRTQALTADSQTLSWCLKSQITFNDELILGGGADE